MYSQRKRYRQAPENAAAIGLVFLLLFLLYTFVGILIYRGL